ncbi:Lipase [Madurella mycetomatis]|uniref:Lipase n=1 Tax=Madurella mycetomatis TaxID=100816 RepID=A0A175WGD2_9PEZI|nr:Lipase [Madurella mycetomatis]
MLRSLRANELVNRPGEAWKLIQLAVKQSMRAKSEAPNLPSDTLGFELKPSQDRKRIQGTVIDNTLVVAIPGSGNIMDWAVNGNYEPTSTRDFGGTAAQFHQGFLAVAKVMQEELANRITATVTALRAQTPEPPEHIDLLLTGHSAGGAMAQLFYSMAMSESSHLAIATIAHNFRRVHCIVFGAPPITTIPIKPPARDPFQSGLFLSIINEGDPVPLLQKEYVEALLRVFVLSAEDLQSHYPNGFRVPDPVFRASGTCVVLCDSDASNLEEDGWIAVKIEEAKLHGKLFGNVSVHSCEQYLERCTSLAGGNGGSRTEELTP